MRTRSKFGQTLAVGAFALAASSGASAATITWTDWTSIAAGTATGNLGGNAVTYTGANTGGNTTGTFLFGPSTSYVGGVVGNAPCTGTTTCVGDIITLTGSQTPTPITLTFASPVTNPIFAIWSLGGNGPASLTFGAGNTPSIQATGPNAQFGFTSLTAASNVVSGQEGNGTFLLPGTFSSIAFSGSFENFYGLTVGTAGPLTAAIPEPGTYALFAAGLASLFGIRRRQKSI
jgi:hypothetical protein